MLEGRAIQDVWTAPRRELRGKPGHELGDHGASLRVGEEIVLEGSFAPGQATRWIFSDITPDSFRWRHVDLPPGDAPEVLRQTMAARRREGGGG